MTSVFSQCESILKNLENNELSKAHEEIRKLADVEKSSFNDKVVESVIHIAEILLELTSTSDVMSAEDFIMHDCPLFPILETAAQYCEEKKDSEREQMDIYNCLYDLCTFRAEFEKGLNYTKKSLDIATESEVIEYKAEATFLCVNAATSCALGIASTFYDNLKDSKEIDVPDDIIEKVNEFVSLIVDFSHEAYLLYIKLAMEGAVHLGLVDASLIDKLDDENILESVTTLSNTLEAAEKTNDVMTLITHLETAAEMNERCIEYDGIGFEELLDKIRDACEDGCCGDCDCDCDCGDECDCCCGKDEEEEKEEEESCKRECCHQDEPADKKVKK